MSRRFTSGILSALIRSAKWHLEEAYSLHASASQSHSLANEKLNETENEMNVLDAYLLSKTSAGWVDVTMLTNASRSRSVLQEKKMILKQDLENCLVRVREARSALIEAKMRLETYERLNSRRRLSWRRIMLRYGQSELDDMGVLRHTAYRSSNLRDFEGGKHD